jgi:hypothetical protein
LTEIGVIAAQGPRHARDLAELIEACDETALSRRHRLVEFIVAR